MTAPRSRKWTLSRSAKKDSKSAPSKACPLSPKFSAAQATEKRQSYVILDNQLITPVPRGAAHGSRDPGFSSINQKPTRVSILSASAIQTKQGPRAAVIRAEVRNVQRWLQPRHRSPVVGVIAPHYPL